MLLHAAEVPRCGQCRQHRLVITQPWLRYERHDSGMQGRLLEGQQQLRAMLSGWQGRRAYWTEVHRLESTSTRLKGVLDSARARFREYLQLVVALTAGAWAVALLGEGCAGKRMWIADCARDGEVEPCLLLGKCAAVQFSRCMANPRKAHGTTICRCNMRQTRCCRRAACRWSSCRLCAYAAATSALVAASAWHVLHLYLDACSSLPARSAPRLKMPAPPIAPTRTTACFSHSRRTWHFAKRQFGSQTKLFKCFDIEQDINAYTSSGAVLFTAVNARAQRAWSRHARLACCCAHHCGQPGSSHQTLGMAEAWAAMYYGGTFVMVGGRHID
jgi:hypothetical protein